MKNFIIKWVINSIAILIVTYIVKGFAVTSPAVAIVAAFMLGVVNAFLRPLVILITLPVNVLTLGLLTLFINGFFLYMVSKIVKGFIITDFWHAFFGAIILSIISFLLSALLAPRKDLFS